MMFPSIKRRVTKANWQSISIVSALDAFVQRAESVGANGVIKLNFEFGDNKIAISGMLIKR